MNTRRTKGVILFCCMLHSTIIASAANAAPTSLAHSPAYTDLELFQGIALGSGRVASDIPMIRNHLGIGSKLLNDASKAEVERLHAKLLEDVARNDPDGLRAFGEAVRSADHFRIDSAMANASGVISRAQKRLIAARPSNISPSVPSDDLVRQKDGTCASVAVEVVAVVFVLAATFVALVNYVIVLQVGFERVAVKGIPHPEDESTNLHDELVDAVAQFAEVQLPAHARP